MEALPKRREAKEKFVALRQRFEDDLIERRDETHEWIKAGGIKTPTLIIWGHNDPSAKWDPMGINALDLILPNTPRAEAHIFNKAGHICYKEYPEVYIATVTNFIRSCEDAS